MPEVIGLTRCPVCGEEGQEVRVNKNRKLYIFCDRGCATHFNGKKSREWLAKLAAGKDIVEANLHILPIKAANTNEKTFEKQETKGVIENDRGRNTVNGRTNGQLAGNSGVQPRQPSGRGWLADWLTDDDDD